MSLNASTVVCVFPSQQTKLIMALTLSPPRVLPLMRQSKIYKSPLVVKGLKYHVGKRRVGPDCMTEQRVTEVNVLQVRACHTFEDLEVLSHEIFCNQLPKCFRVHLPYISSETHDSKKVNAIYFYRFYS